jgi:hypothetical protein
MKKYFWIVLLLIAVAGIYILINRSTGEAGLRDATNFAVNDVRKIDLITIKDREGKSIVLEKKEDYWMVNKKYKASQKSMEFLLNETISQIRIKGPVPTASRETVIRRMVGNSKHVKIYEDGKLIRDYYVGPPNPDQSGSYLHIEGSETPYIAHILGYASVLDPKYSTDIQDWYDRTVFDYTAQEIAKIIVTNNEMPNESFALSRIDSTYSIQPALSQFSQSAARSYFSLFTFKNFEGFANYLTPKSKDSIAKSVPYMTIAAVLTNGHTQELKLYRKGNFTDGQTLVDKNGNTVIQDTERYFATFTGFKEVVTVQEYVFGKMITRRSFFDARFGQKP